MCYPSYDWSYDALHPSYAGGAGPGRLTGTYAAAAASVRRGVQPDATGVCAVPHPGVLLPRAFPTPWPTPLAYFPLSQVGLS